MSMPRQLRYAKRRKRSEPPRPLVELLPYIGVGDLVRLDVFPDQCDWHGRYRVYLPFQYPFIEDMIVGLQNIEVRHHAGHNQVIRIRWVHTGFGRAARPRPLLYCQCGRSVWKLYFRNATLRCRRCTNAVFASQVLRKRTRPILQAKRIQFLLDHQFALGHKTRRRLEARITAPPTKNLTSKRLNHRALLPVTKHCIRGEATWR
jgi:hypothetical protein